MAEQNPAYRSASNTKNMPAWAIILAAGSGSRMGASAGPRPKQFLHWRGRPIYWHSAMTFSRSQCVDGLVFVFPEAEIEHEKELLARLAFEDNLGLPWLAACGGPRRQDSCRNGIVIIPDRTEKILVHDAARPFMSAALARRVCQSVSSTCPCVVPAVSVTDTIRILDITGRLAEKTLPRSRLGACQTPQGFWSEALFQALRTCGAADVTDEATLMENMGFKVGIVRGDAANIKITTPNDLRCLAENKTQVLPCNGFGYDVHRYGGTRPLRLGGVPIPGNYTVEAHSDGDVLLHALMDALFGAACLGDIGAHFPENDPRYEDIASTILMDRTLEMVTEKKIRICHIDLTVVAQKPRLAPYAADIRDNVAALLKLPGDAVNFKATTEEKLGFTGLCQGIKAYALASCVKLAKL